MKNEEQHARIWRHIADAASRHSQTYKEKGLLEVGERFKMVEATILDAVDALTGGKNAASK